MVQQDICYYLNGMLFVVDGDQLMVVVIDGYCFVFLLMKFEGGMFGCQEVIVLCKMIFEFQCLFEDIDDIVIIDIVQIQVKFMFGQVEFVLKFVEGKFFDFQCVILKVYKNMFEIGCEELQCLLQCVVILILDKFKGVCCIIVLGQLKIMLINVDQEEVQEEFEIVYQGDIVDIGFNVMYLFDVFVNLKVDIVQVSFGDVSLSVLIIVFENDEFKYVVMLMCI